MGIMVYFLIAGHAGFISSTVPCVILYYTLLYYAMLYYAMLCYTMLCYARLYYAMAQHLGSAFSCGFPKPCKTTVSMLKIQLVFFQSR